jgi:hypothetical protein
MQIERERTKHVTESRAGAAFVAVLMLLGAVVFAQALIIRDSSQIILHQRDVTPGLPR